MSRGSRRKKVNMIKKQRGVALIFALLITTLLLTFGTATVSRSVSESSIARRYARSNQAFWLAEAGLQETIFTLNNDDWTGWEDLGGGARRRSVNLGAGEFSILVTGIGTSNLLAVTTGNVAGMQRVIEAKVEEDADSPFTYAGFAKGELTMSGNGRTNSYDSSLGAYGGSNIGTNGDIGSNGTAAGTIRLSGNAYIQGDASTGPDGTVITNGNAEIEGTISDDNDVDMASVVVPAQLTALPSSGSYSVGGNNSRTISAGDYKYTSLGISANARVTITGTVRIYLTDNSSLDIAGNGQLIVGNGASLELYTDGRCNMAGNGVVNNSGLPHNFILFSTYAGTGDGVKIAGNGNLHGAIYAPDSTVRFSGNADVFGSVVGSNLYVTGNGSIHYDEALKEVQGFSHHYSIQSWREQNNPYGLSP